MSNVKHNYYAKINRNLKKYSLTINEFKENPSLLFVKDISFRNYVYKTFSPHKPITWYGKPYTWANNIPSKFYNTIENENIQWFNDLITKDIFDDNEDDLFNQADAETEISPPAKKSKTENSEETTDSSQTLQSDTTSASDTISMQSGSSSNKRPSESDTSSANKKPALENQDRKDSNSASTTNLATGIAENTGATKSQGNPTGSGEVDQDNAQQRQTERGNAHNERGTLQGEAGNLKIQKPLECYGIVKVKMNYNKFVNKVFVFVSDDKELSNDLTELMEESYENSDIYTHKIELLNYNADICAKIKNFIYIVGWRLPFNIGYPTLALKLGNRYNKILSFAKTVDNFDEVNEILEKAVVVRLKNDTQLLTLSENVAKANDDYTKYNNPASKKRKLINKFD